MPLAISVAERVFRNFEFSGQGRAGKDAQVDLGDPVFFRAQRLRDLAAAGKLAFVPLSIAKGKRVGFKALCPADSEGGGGIEPATQEDNGAIHRARAVRSVRMRSQ